MVGKSLQVCSFAFLLTKSRKKALVLIYCCLQRLFLTAYISRLTTHLRRLDVCNCASESSNKVQPKKLHSLDHTVSTNAKLTVVLKGNSAVYPLFLLHVRSSLVLHDISTFFQQHLTIYTIFLPFQTACTRRSEKNMVKLYIFGGNTFM